MYKVRMSPHTYSGSVFCVSAETYKMYVHVYLLVSEAVADDEEGVTAAEDGDHTDDVSDDVAHYISKLGRAASAAVRFLRVSSRSVGAFLIWSRFRP